MCKAPAINQSYEGPVMFDQEAVGYIVSEAFFNSSNALISKRKNIESGASSFDVFALLGGENSKINKYEAQIGKEVIDKNISLTAIDKTTMFENTPLIGSYVVDAEGVSVADKLPLIANGILQTLLRDRIPTAQMPQSNAHKRFALNYNELTPSLSPGVVEFTAKKTMSEEKAKKQLLSLAKSKGLEYAYIVRKFANYTDFSGEDIASSVLRMSLGLNTIKPFYIYKVSVKDGSETLVRMAIMSKITMETFKKVAAVASGQQVYNTMLPSEGQGGLGSLFSTGGGVPSSFIVPTAIVLEDVEIKKDQGVILQKPFVTPNPLTE
ncbi:MAG: hypothetical protein GX109_04805 [Bacteroidales bacterium]|nr:hypothetical protein [Bacteroidales bacterium]